MGESWACEAYGPEGQAFGALCFLSAGERICGSLDECRQAMASERRRVFRRINELAADGDDTAAYLEQEFSHPDQLTGFGGQGDDS